MGFLPQPHARKSPATTCSRRKQPQLAGDTSKHYRSCQRTQNLPENTTTATGTTKTTKNLLDFARNLLKTSRRRHKWSETVGEDQNSPVTPTRTAKEPIDKHPLRTTVKMHGKGIFFLFHQRRFGHHVQLLRALSRHSPCGLSPDGQRCRQIKNQTRGF